VARLASQRIIGCEAKVAAPFSRPVSTIGRQEYGREIKGPEFALSRQVHSAKTHTDETTGIGSFSAL
jgi:hypothetical protein